MSKVSNILWYRMFKNNNLKRKYTVNKLVIISKDSLSDFDFSESNAFTQVL